MRLVNPSSFRVFNHKYLMHLLLFFFCPSDFRTEREKRDALEREDKKRLLRLQKEKEKEEEKERKAREELYSYKNLQNPDKMCSNYDEGNDSDEFM